MAKLGRSVKCLESESDALIIERFSPLDRPQFSENNIPTSKKFFDLDQPVFPKRILQTGPDEVEVVILEKVETSLWPCGGGFGIQTTASPACQALAGTGDMLNLKSGRCGFLRPNDDKIYQACCGLPGMLSLFWRS